MTALNKLQHLIHAPSTCYQFQVSFFKVNAFLLYKNSPTTKTGVE
jgi:hypothetical protein